MTSKRDAPNPCPHCGRYICRTATVDAVVMEREKLLLIRRSNDPYKGYWALPGGYIDLDETAGEACLRELKEETGLDAQTMDFIGEFSNPGRHPEQCISLAFLVSEWKNKVKAGDDAAEAGWFSLDKLPPNIAFDHQKIIECALAYKKQYY